MSQTVSRVLDEATEFLASRRPRSPRLDAELLLAYVTGQTRTQLFTRAFEQLSAAHLAQFQDLLEKRGQGAPVAYLIGWKEFYGRRFVVTPDVLIPRPETEMVVEETLRCVARSGLARPRIFDCCTGSGCLAVTLALEVAEAQVRASDVCPKALEVAAENLRLHNLERRIKLFEGDLLKALPPETQRYDFIVSNPPYVATDSGPRPEEGVVHYEPNLALFGGRDGTDLLKRLSQEARRRLNPGGWLVLEMAPFQIEGMEAFLQEQGYQHTQLTQDLSGLPRVLSGRWEA
ncbi:MAG: peptide chain release factor N(5)-glutamine methyltransferase [Candidatus Eremiobacteraeota bacterium]|nr:peptide chain release factor N(5)-glutamine methyltransferase [Candidatus Eremiobacteraeota bacterium]MCW5871599.1 peptide chain release factor N(5)-glutamine methyltransferase [Candidatus Eremiobacteraeota bacterium]